MLNREKGTTLVEVMIAIAVLLLIAISCSRLARIVIYSGVSSENRAIAYSLAANVIEILKNKKETNLLDNDPETDLSTDLTLDYLFSQLQNYGFDKVEKEGDKIKVKIGNTEFTIVLNLETPKETLLPAEMLEFINKVKITIKWREKTGEKFFVTRGYLTNWRIR